MSLSTVSAWTSMLPISNKMSSVGIASLDEGSSLE